MLLIVSTIAGGCVLIAVAGFVRLRDDIRITKAFGFSK